MELLEVVFGQYAAYSTQDITLEICAIIASLISVYFSFKNKVLVFPFGIISTVIFVYLLYKWNLLGDMIINGYYFIMSIYGWYLWSLSKNGAAVVPVTTTTFKEWRTAIVIVAAAIIGVYIIYSYANALEKWVSFIDMLTTGIFFAGMWLMARRKLEHWLVLLLGNVISVPLYFYKGYSFSALLYLILAIIAYYGFISWKNNQLNLKQVL